MNSIVTMIDKVKQMMEPYTLAMTRASNKLRDISLLMMRLVLAYGFYQPAMNKIQNFDSVVSWFADSLHLPFPYLNALMATGFEVMGVVLLTLGLMTRLISIPLMVIMVVAVLTVHGFENFSAAENGFEIPLYYFVMLMVLMTSGPGKISIDESGLKSCFVVD